MIVSKTDACGDTLMWKRLAEDSIFFWLDHFIRAFIAQEILLIILGILVIFNTDLPIGWSILVTASLVCFFFIDVNPLMGSAWAALTMLLVCVLASRNWALSPADQISRISKILRYSAQSGSQGLVDYGIMEWRLRQGWWVLPLIMLAQVSFIGRPIRLRHYRNAHRH